MPILATVIFGVVGWGVVRLISVFWPRLADLRAMIWSLVFMTIVGRLFVVVIAVLAAVDAFTHVALAREVISALWPVVAIALGLEVVWRIAIAALGFGADRVHVRAPRTPWTNVTPRAAKPPRVEPQVPPPPARPRASVATDWRRQPSRPVPRAPAAILGSQPSLSVRRAPASVVDAKPSERRLPQMRLNAPVPTFQSSEHPAATRRTFESNVALTLAQLVAMAQGALGIIGGVDAVRARDDVNGVIAIGISALVIVAGAVVARPSRAARSALIVWELVALLFTIGSLLHAHDLFRPVLAAAGIGVVDPLASLALEAVILYGLLLHNATRNAFAR